MATENLKKLFIEELKDIYSGESQILKALPKLAKAARSSELREALETHLEESQGHISQAVMRYDRVLELDPDNLDAARRRRALGRRR